MGITDQLVSQLQEGPQSIDQLCEDLDLSRGLMIREAKQLKEEGIAELEEIERYEVRPGKKYMEHIPEKYLLEKLGSAQEGDVGTIKTTIGKDAFSRGFNHMQRQGYMSIDNGVLKANIDNEVHEEVESLDQHLQHIINNGYVREIDEKTQQLEKRNIIKTKYRPDYTVTLLKTPESREEDKVTRLTPEMIADGSWKEATFKAYDIHDPAKTLPAGREHPLRSLMYRIKDIFNGMGFKEMYGDYVQASLYNFDLLLTPQDHPARELQDTVFLQEPEKASVPHELLERAKETHEDFYGATFSEETAMQNVLRTHTTAITALYLSEIETTPEKYFIVGRVFRNETTDRLHLPEFHHIEGVVIGDVSLRDLMGTITEFYKELGVENIQFKPTFNPYTEPSTEIFGYHPQLDEVVELGNAGMFRPEMMEMFNMPGQKSIAWGLSLERLAGILYQCDSIKNLLGDEGDINWFRYRPI